MDTFVRFNIDQLYNDPKLRKLFQSKKQVSKDIDVLLEFKSVNRRKELFEKNVINFMIGKLENRRKRLVEKAMEDVLKNTHFSKDYFIRQNYIDSNIEDTIKYYNPSIRTKVMISEGLDIPKIQKQLRKNRETLLNKK